MSPIPEMPRVAVTYIYIPVTYAFAFPFPRAACVRQAAINHGLMYLPTYTLTTYYSALMSLDLTYLQKAPVADRAEDNLCYPIVRERVLSPACLLA